MEEITGNILNGLSREIVNTEKREYISFNSFLAFVNSRPKQALRNVFQVMRDMIGEYTVPGENEYRDDPESIGYINYDCSKLFVDGVDRPFFADRLFANRLVNNFSSLNTTAQQNKIYIFEGPHGCGKSTFLNNLLRKFEEYSNTEDGFMYEVVWRLDIKLLGGFSNCKTRCDDSGDTHDYSLGDFLEVPCPSHDNPLLMIPVVYRKDFIDNLIKNDLFKKKLFNEKEYEWLFKDKPCTICQSLFDVLLDKLGSPQEVFNMILARKMKVDRRLGDGVSVFNPGDKGPRESVVTNPILQKQLNRLLKDSNLVKYIYSILAKTNNGIYALMDIKSHNKERLGNLHGIISEGVHKVEDKEESVNSLFIAVMNPEDNRDDMTESIRCDKSFQDRKVYINIPYVLDYKTEVLILKDSFGGKIEKSFLPRVLDNFAKIIIASRLDTNSVAMKKWIAEPEKYFSHCDYDLLLLKMNIYTGIIPLWVSEEDRKRFTSRLRSELINESVSEGYYGFSGRDSLEIFHDFYLSHAKDGKPITMMMLYNFFTKEGNTFSDTLPERFMDAIVDLYDYSVLQEVKESLYCYNEDQISIDIQNYLFAINFEIGQTEICRYTGEKLEISNSFFRFAEKRFLGLGVSDEECFDFRESMQRVYTSITLPQEIMVSDINICNTEQYLSLYDKYIFNLKESVLDPFLDNENFRRAIRDYGTEKFKTYDKKIKTNIKYLISNLVNKFGYSQEGAREVSMYVVDNDIAYEFAGE